MSQESDRALRDAMTRIGLLESRVALLERAAARAPERRPRPAGDGDSLTQKRILRQLQKQNKRAGFSWVRVAALIVLIFIIFVALAA